MKPSIGRIVHYVAHGSPDGTYKPGEHRAAIITAVHNETAISAAVLNPTGLQFAASLFQDEGEKKPGSWHWPERVE